jgi:thiamine pyrophosphate-dependent acetolactate synthase large subunit-like protein
MTDEAHSASDRHALLPLTGALEVLVKTRRNDQIVVTSMGSAREWPRLCQHPLDLHYVPSTMSGAIPLSLGLALAQPQREVLVCSGDGSLLMSLGCLVTVVASGVKNLTIVLLDNGVYEITGGQTTAAAQADADFARLAQAAGFSSVAQFKQLDRWQKGWPAIFALAGPRFVWLKTEPVRERYHLDPPMPMQEQLKRLCRGLEKDLELA